MADPITKIKKVSPQNNAPLGPMDNAFLLFEEDCQPMTIGNIWEIDRKVSLEYFIENTRPLMEREEYRRYRQVVKGDPAEYTTKWVDDPNFNVKNHIFEHHLPAPGNKEQLQDLISDLFTGALDRSKPLWDSHLIQGVDGDRTVLVYRLHHAVTDGQGSIRALLSVTSLDEDLTKKQYSAGARQKVRRQSLTQTVAKQVKKIGTKIINIPVQILWFLYHIVLMTIFQFKFMLRPKISFYRAPDKMNRKKKVAWSETVPLDDVKFIKNTFGGTINDVLVSCVTGALRSHLLASNQPVQELICAIPVSMRRPDDFELKNDSTMIYMMLPTCEADPIERMKTVHERTDVFKNSPAPFIQHYLGTIFYSTSFGTRAVNSWNKTPKKFIASRAHGVLTNVPGPQVPIMIGEAMVTKYIPFIPQHGAGGLGMGVLSYNGTVGLGIVTEDDFLVGGPADICDRFSKEFAELLASAKAKAAGGSTEGKKDM